MAGEVSTSVEADAVVGDLEGYAFGISRHFHVHAPGPGVLDGFVEGFLGDAVDGPLGKAAAKG